MKSKFSLMISIKICIKYDLISTCSIFKTILTEKMKEDYTVYLLGTLTSEHSKQYSF